MAVKFLELVVNFLLRRERPGLLLVLTGAYTSFFINSLIMLPILFLIFRDSVIFLLNTMTIISKKE